MAAVERSTFGQCEGRDVSLYTLANGGGLSARITDYGGILTELHVPDRDGKSADVVLGFDRLEPYLARHPFFGALVGRYANRIRGGEFQLDGVTYRLAANEAPNHLHGGLRGFDKAVWGAESGEAEDGPVLRLSHVSPDGDEGYPGTLEVAAEYRLTSDNALELDFTATVDRPTVINLVNHTYWNLAGHGAGNVMNQRMLFHADSYTATDATLIPTGGILPVEGTPFDFREARTIGRAMERLDAGVRGYDVNFVVTGEPGTLRPAAELSDPTSGRVLEVSTTAPGVQFYTGHKMDGSLRGKDGVAYGACAGLCLETQNYPDAPNQPSFPSAVLRPGETYRHRTVYRFSTRPQS